jgi:hypothetical protein
VPRASPIFMRKGLRKGREPAAGRCAATATFNSSIERDSSAAWITAIEERCGALFLPIRTGKVARSVYLFTLCARPLRETADTPSTRAATRRTRERPRAPPSSRGTSGQQVAVEHPRQGGGNRPSLQAQSRCRPVRIAGSCLTRLLRHFRRREGTDRRLLQGTSSQRCSRSPQASHRRLRPSAGAGELAKSDRRLSGCQLASCVDPS